MDNNTIMNDIYSNYITTSNHSELDDDIINDSYFDYTTTLEYDEIVPDLDINFARRSLKVDKFLWELDQILDNNTLSKRHDIFCPKCIKVITYANWSRHCKTKTHITNSN